MSNGTASGTETDSRSLPRPSRKIRWWPGLLIIGAALVGGLWIHFWEDTHQQGRNLQTICLGLASILLLIIWCLCFSRFRWRIRLIVMAGFIGTLGAATLSLTMRGVTGDLLPILEWRWHRYQPQPLPMQEAMSVKPALSVEAGPSAGAPDGYPQFLGPNRNATLSSPTLARDWTSRPPQQIWRRGIGAGWSGFAVTRGSAVTQEQDGPREKVVCYDALSGRLIWSYCDVERFFKTIAGEGPRATPTIDGDRVYTLGATGILNCLDLPTGRLIWARNIIQDNRSRVPEWGLSGSPLIVDDLVVVSAGGSDGRSFVAYDKRDGQFVWGGGSDAASYSSPVICSIAGTRQVLMFNASLIAAHDPGSGQLLWQYPWSAAQAHVAVPVMLPGDRVLVTSGYGTGSEAVQIKSDATGNWTASRVWKSNRLKAKFTNVVYHEGSIYGLDDGIMVCIDAATGEQKWKNGRYGHGQNILVGKLLLVMAESGEIVLVEPVPQELRELARFRAFNTKTWNPPALAGELLFVRNDREAACFRLPVEK